MTAATPALQLGGIARTHGATLSGEHQLYLSTMKLTGGSDDELLSEAWAYLTNEEALIHFKALTFYFEDSLDDPGWHHHIGGGDSSPELTIAIVK
jgi:hypothetical protein